MPKCRVLRGFRGAQRLCSTACSRPGYSGIEAQVTWGRRQKRNESSEEGVERAASDEGSSDSFIDEVRRARR